MQNQLRFLIILILSVSRFNAQEITLDSCDSWINSNAPAFFQKYFDCADITVNDDYIVIHTDGNPPHQSWYYPSSHPNYILFVSQGDGYFLNPNTIAGQDFNLSIPRNPVSLGITIDASLVDGNVNSSSFEYPMGLAGIALDGVALFNPLAAPQPDIAEEKFSFDYYNAHPTNNGMYHYHTSTKGPLEVLENIGLITNALPDSAEIEVYGIMCDGTIVLGCTELNGSTPVADDFDAQNGHVHDLMDEDSVTHFVDRYHTHLCPGDYSYDYTPEIRYYNTCYREVLSLTDEWIPNEYSVYQNYPNPFNPTTTIYYDLPEQTDVEITVHDMIGRNVRTLINQNQSAGMKSVFWDARDANGNQLSSGIYIYRVSAGSFTATKKMVLLK